MICRLIIKNDLEKRWHLYENAVLGTILGYEIPHFDRIAYIHSTVQYGMLRCEYCTRNFGATHNGFAEKTFHELLHGPNVVNE